MDDIQRMPVGFDGFALDCPFPMPDISTDILRELVAVGQAKGLVYFLHTPARLVRLGDPLLAVRQAALVEMKKLLDFADRVGARLITIHPTPRVQNDLHDAVEKFQREALQDLCAYGAIHGIRVALENMQPGDVFPPGYSDCTELVALAEEISLLTITFDVGHAHMAGLSLPTVIHRFGRRLGHIHIHDNDGTGDQHLPVGQGTIDWSGLMQAIAQNHYHGFLELEFQGHDAQVASKEYLEALLP
jgi:sugar phosphate isomerase/epimerase